MYKVKQNLKPSNLIGLSNEQIDDHWTLYEGYVKQVNLLNEELKSADPSSLVYADRRRRYGFEYNGMVLHEYYFENMISSGIKISDVPFKKVLEESFGSFNTWQKDFEACGKTRGIGWAILYLDGTTKKLTNHFVAEHQNGHIAGFKPILVMDIWEHAYMVDYKAGGRGEYIQAFISNINWDVVNSRF
jgi:Fe-Mn family superoxide dismutase